MKLKTYSDCSCKGNPGPSAIAFLILDSQGRTLKEHSEYIGSGTNNQAEYKALIAALESAINFGDEVECHVNSDLVVKQLTGQIHVHNPRMRTLWRQAVALKENFRKTAFIFASKTDLFIERAERLAKQELRGISKKRALQKRTLFDEKLLLQEMEKGLGDSSMILMDDAGWGDLLLGVVIGALKIPGHIYAERRIPVAILACLFTLFLLIRGSLSTLESYSYILDRHSRMFQDTTVPQQLPLYPQ